MSQHRREGSVVPGAGVQAYYTPLITDEVTSADPGGLLNAAINVAWTQDPVTGLHTIDSIANGANAGGVDPNLFAYRIIPMKDSVGATVGLDELESCKIYLDVASGFAANDTTAVYAGIVVGPAITDPRLWARIDSNGAFIGRTRAGDAGVQGAAPAGTGVVRGRITFFMEPTATASRMEVNNMFIGGMNGANQAIVNSENVLNGVAQALDKVPHIILAVGAFSAPAEKLFTFNCQVLAQRRPGGALPQ